MFTRRPGRKAGEQDYHLCPACRSTPESWDFRIHSTELDELEKEGSNLRCMVAKVF